MDFNGKICLVTGGSRGLGRSIAESLLKRGAKCLIVDILFMEGEATEAELGSKYGKENILFMRVDVSSHNNFEQAFIKCLDHFKSLDVVVNNAGINGEINWEAQLSINLFGTIRGTKMAIRYMGKNGRPGEGTLKGGIVLNVSSVQALLNWPVMPTYSSGKAAIVAYSRSEGHPLEVERHGVKIVCLCPNAAETPIQHYVHHIGLTEVAQNFFNGIDLKTNILTSDEVGEGAAKVMDEGHTGSVWYMHKSGDQPYEVPDEKSWENLLKHQPK